MSVRSIPLFFGGKATPFLRAQWTLRTSQPLLTALPLVDEEGLATKEFRSLWAATFQERRPLPRVPISDKDGRGTLEFWDAFL